MTKNWKEEIKRMEREDQEKQKRQKGGILIVVISGSEKRKRP